MLEFAILRAVSLLVPCDKRPEWLAERRSELWYVRATCRPREVRVFSLGMFPDALWLRRNSPPLNVRKLFNLQSPLRCVIVLAVLASVSFLFALHMVGVHGVESLIREHRMLPHLLMILYALLVLLLTTSLDFGEFPPQGHRSSWSGKRWMLFATKIAFLISTVFCGGLTLIAIGATPIIGPVLLLSYVLVFRWALADQRRRCPVCLRVLINPVRIGQSSQTLLAWYGTELTCLKGHGVLHVPEIPSSCYRTQRWLYLDTSE